MKLKSLFSTFLIAATLSGCSSTKTFVDGLDNDKPSYDELYLRGSFTWWEADEAYKVVKFDESIYRVVVELVADGQPYDFKFADKAWSEGLSCGYKDKVSDEYLALDKMGCDHYQGYYFSKPITAKKLIEKVQEQEGLLRGFEV